MQIQNIGTALTAADNANKNTHKVALSGADDFARQLHKHALISQKTDTGITAHGPQSEQNSHIKLGALSKTNNTVAQLLLANKELKANTWSIIHNSINKNKSFHQIPLGQEIFYNQRTQEISWSGQPPKTQVLSPVNNDAQKDSEKLLLGEINSKNPTIANLLAQHTDLKAQRWNIIHDTVNQDKAFNRIPSGSSIYLDAKTRELSWTSPGKPEATQAFISDNNILLSKKLDDAVKPYMGTDYKDIDCYTLVVNGLKKLGVRYRGQDSLSGQLLQMAKAEGRPSNAYFTGEGITEAMGEKVYTRAISKVNNIEQQSQAVFQEMQNLMKKGDILSFSLETKGHTGIISQNDKQWTYINSGRLDHSISQNAPKNGVGEETLLSEISNWIKLAHKRNESLQITIGRLDTRKFA